MNNPHPPARLRRRAAVSSAATPPPFLAAPPGAGVGGLARSAAMGGWHHGVMDGTHSAARSRRTSITCSSTSTWRSMRPTRRRLRSTSVKQQ